MATKPKYEPNTISHRIPQQNTLITYVSKPGCCFEKKNLICLQISKILIARPELTTMAKKLKARDSIGKKEREIFGGQFQQRFFLTIFN
jgi:hypothetical protein